MAYRVMAYRVMAYIVLAYLAMAYRVMACVFMAYRVVAYIVMASIFMAYRFAARIRELDGEVAVVVDALSPSSIVAAEQRPSSAQFPTFVPRYAITIYAATV